MAMMILSATLSKPELAAILGVSEADATTRLREAQVETWGTDENVRIGWQAARSLVSETMTGDEEKRAALARLRDLRAGVLRISAESDAPELEQTSKTARPVDELDRRRVIEIVRSYVDETGPVRHSELDFSLWAVALGITAEDVCDRLEAEWPAVLAWAEEPADSFPHEQIPPHIEELLQGLKEASRALGGGEKISRRAFDRWLSECGISGTSQQLVYFFGTWNAAKRSISVGTRRHTAEFVIDDDDLLLLIRQAAKDLGRGRDLMKDEFHRWCKKNRPLVSSYTVVTRFHGWKQAKRLAGLMEAPKASKKDRSNGSKPGSKSPQGELSSTQYMQTAPMRSHGGSISVGETETP